MLGHELTHIRNGDVQLMVIAVIIAGVVGFFAELFFRMFFNFGWLRRRPVIVVIVVVLGRRQRKGSGGGAIVVIIIAVALIALAWLLSQVVRLALSRSRELLADAGSVELTKNPDAMISALRKIENRGELPGAHLRGDGIVRRQSARGFFRPVRDPSFGGFAGAGAGEIRRRPRSRAAGAAVGYDRRWPGDRHGKPPTPGPAAPIRRRPAHRATRQGASKARRRSLGQSCRPWARPARPAQSGIQLPARWDRMAAAYWIRLRGYDSGCSAGIAAAPQR